MNESHVISQEVLDLVQLALLKGENWMAYNGSMYFIDKNDIYFFSDKDAANGFANDNISDHDHFHVIHINSEADVLKLIPYGQELQIDPDRNPLYDKDGNAFTDALIEHLEQNQFLNNKTNQMNTQNLESLKKDIFFAGFGESLNQALEDNMREKKPEFTLMTSREFGSDKMDALLHFKESNGNYYFNRYDATLNRNKGNLSQSFYINSLGQSITLKEACNLLNGRAVYKELAKKPEEGQTIKSGEDIQTYKTWLQLDLEKKDEKGQFVVNRFHDKYGFHMHKELDKLPIKEMKNENAAKIIVNSLEKGSPVTATLMLGDKETKISLTADPANRALEMRDEKGNPLSLPGHEKSQTQKQGDDVKQNGKKKDLLQKNKDTNGLINKKRKVNKQGLSVG
jgi:hypothetical protein